MQKIETEIINYDNQLYSKDTRTAAWFLLRWASNKHTSLEQAAWLEKSFEEEDIKEAVFSLEANKAPGPDRFTMMFSNAGK